MASPLVVGLVCAGLWAAGPPRPSPVPDLPLSGRAFLESCRRHLAFLKEDAAWRGKLAAEMEELSAKVPRVITPERLDRLRRGLGDSGADVKKWERWVAELERFVELREGNPGSGEEDEAIDRLVRLQRELWGPAPAPMPREKK